MTTLTSIPPVLPTKVGATQRTTISLPLGNRSYTIDIGSGLLGNALPSSMLTDASNVVLISNTTVFPIYGQGVLDTLARANKRTISIVLPDGEQFKNWDTLMQIFDKLLQNACDRKTLLVALGGGVIGDMVGFAAATYQRGVPFLQLPTTLLAQVDSSVGGKTAINHPLGKNMIGAFYQPKHVVIDTDVLMTLPDREYRAGIAEVIKYGVALDREFFDWIEANIDSLMARSADATAYAIQRSCELKAGIVMADELETNNVGGRALLNFGHTFGHAIEAELGYGVWLHGEAVGCGMVLATNLSAELGSLSATEAKRITSLIRRAGLPMTIPNIAPADLLRHMARDKKNEGGKMRLILLDGIGVGRVDATLHQDRIDLFLQQRDA